jgi:hypothetical protein
MSTSPDLSMDQRADGTWVMTAAARVAAVHGLAGEPGR